MLKQKNTVNEINNEAGADTLATNKKSSRIKALSYMAITAASCSPLIALAENETGGGQGNFSGFQTAITDLLTGSLGKGVALLALLLGGLIGLAKSSAWPALTGLAIAAIFGLGPYMIDAIFGMFGTMTYTPGA